MTKLYMPPVRPSLVPRPRLIERLNEGLYRKLTLVSAPAGFGKTTLISEWLGLLDRPSAWLSLDEGDSDPVQFLTYLIAALQQVDEGIGRTVLDLLQSSQLPPMQSLVTLLINDIAAAGTPLTLVLDDYQLVSAASVHQILQVLLDRQPPTIHLVIGTREDPPLPLPRLRARGQVTEIRERDLRFTEGEAAEFLSQTMGLHLDADTVRALEARTEGWVVGLQLAALALQEGRADAEAFVTAFTGDDRYVMDYLIAEVLNRQPDETRAFLCQTSVLDRFTASLCNAVTGREDSQAVLECLEGANLFLFSLDHRREWYRYHRLFAEFLRTTLAPDKRALLHLRAMRWYRAAVQTPGFLGQAIGHAVAYGSASTTSLPGQSQALRQPTEDSRLPGQALRRPTEDSRLPGQALRLDSGQAWDEAEQLIGMAAEETIHAGGVLTMRRWLDALPDERVRANGELAIYKGWVLALSGEMALAEEYAGAAEECFRKAKDVDRGESGRLLVLRSWLAVLFHQDYASALELAAGALRALGDDQPHWRVIALWTMAESQERTRPITEAIVTLWEALRAGQTLGNQVFVATVEISLALALNNHGRRREAVAVCEEAIKRYTDETGRLSPIAGLILSRMGMLHYEANHLDLARKCHDLGMSLSEQVASEYNLAFFQGLSAPIFYAQGEVEMALAALQQGYQVALQTGFVDAEWFFSREVNVRLMEGDLGFALRWVEKRGLSPDDDPEYLTIEQHLVYARVLLAQGRLSDTRCWLARLERFTRERGLYRWLITVHVLQALTAERSGDRALTWDRISRALQEAAPQDYLRAFLDEGGRVPGLLTRARDVAPAFVDRLLAAFRSARSGVASQGASMPASSPKAELCDQPIEPLPEPLSERELEVLGLIAAGLSNREISQELYITVGTVKRHTNHIYGKLGVHSRTQAAAKARELGLL
jgi:LuxR family maltose regulon positive regulatory protein